MINYNTKYTLFLELKICNIVHKKNNFFMSPNFFQVRNGKKMKKQKQKSNLQV